MQGSKDTDVKKRLSDSVGEGKSGMIWEKGIETGIISYVKRIATPGLMHDTGLGREVGRGFRMGNTCIPVADSFWYMAKPIQYCKVKK